MMRENIEEFSKLERSYYHDERYHTYKLYGKEFANLFFNHEIEHLEENFEDLIKGRYGMRGEVIGILNTAFMRSKKLFKDSMFLVEFYDPKDFELQNAIFRYLNFMEGHHRNCIQNSFKINQFRHLRTKDKDSFIKEMKFFQLFNSVLIDEHLHSLIAREVCLFILRKSNHSAFKDVFYHTYNAGTYFKKYSKMLRTLKYKFISFRYTLNDSRYGPLALRALNKLNVFTNHELLNFIQQASNNNLSNLEIDLNVGNIDITNGNEYRLFNTLYRYLALFDENCMWKSVNLFEIISALMLILNKFPKTNEYLEELKLIEVSLAQRFDLSVVYEIPNEITLFKLYFSLCESVGVSMYKTHVWALKIFFLSYLEFSRSKAVLSHDILKTLISHAEDDVDLLQKFKIFGIFHLILTREYNENAIDPEDRYEEWHVFQLRINYPLRSEMIRLLNKLDF